MTSIAKTMASHALKFTQCGGEEDTYTKGKTWEEVFFNTLWMQNFISPSTPMMANAGLRKRGTTVSCSGGWLGTTCLTVTTLLLEAAILTKHSHGTSYSIDAWPAGRETSRGGRILGCNATNS